jgi:ATP-dependent Clp protease adaptor protein ClpS
MTTITAPPKEETESQEEQQSKILPPYHVILLNDDDHSFEYVINMMQKLFGHPPERGYTIALAVHTQGRAICDTTSKERAELKQDQIHAFGRDPSIPRCQGSMTAIIEPAE